MSSSSSSSSNGSSRISREAPNPYLDNKNRTGGTVDVKKSRNNDEFDGDLEYLN